MIWWLPCLLGLDS